MAMPYSIRVRYNKWCSSACACCSMPFADVTQYAWTNNAAHIETNKCGFLRSKCRRARVCVRAGATNGHDLLETSSWRWAPHQIYLPEMISANWSPANTIVVYLLRTSADSFGSACPARICLSMKRACTYGSVRVRMWSTRAWNAHEDKLSTLSVWLLLVMDAESHTNQY